jgi:hypothetical protein
MIYFIHKDLQHELTCFINAQGLIDAYAKHGCKTLSETEFLRLGIQPALDDVIIVYISLKNPDAMKKLEALECRTILYSCDESKSDEILFRTQLEFCSRFNVTTMINMYPSKRNIDFLSSKGIKTITMPQCGWPRKVDFAQKDIDVLVSGQLDGKYYTVRTNIARALQMLNPRFKWAILPHAGMEGSQAQHRFHGANFLSLLDRCWIGSTCRAGAFRDRMVPKYIEFGFSKVLPIGSVPTYMHPDMASSMIAIDESTPPEIIVKRLYDVLADRETLKKRIETYSSIVERDHNMDANIIRVLNMIVSNTHDTV